MFNRSDTPLLPVTRYIDNQICKMINIQINGRFKIYDDLVVINKEIWQLSTFQKGTKRTKPMRKLKYYPNRNAYGYNGSYISKSKLLNLHYVCDKTIDKRNSKNF